MLNWLLARGSHWGIFRGKRPKDPRTSQLGFGLVSIPANGKRRAQIGLSIHNDNREDLFWFYRVAYDQWSSMKQQRKDRKDGCTEPQTSLAGTSLRADLRCAEGVKKRGTGATVHKIKKGTPPLSLESCQLLPFHQPATSEPSY